MPPGKIIALILVMLASLGLSLWVRRLVKYYQGLGMSDLATAFSFLLVISSLLNLVTLVGIWFEIKK
jgi:hypothetical protein